MKTGTAADRLRAHAYVTDRVDRVVDDLAAAEGEMTREAARGAAKALVEYAFYTLVTQGEVAPELAAAAIANCARELAR